MSSGDEKSREDSPTSGQVSRTSSRGSSRGSGSARRPQGPGNIIEFVDSQDPNVKSAIQRHTAYHSAAQRREARLRSLRRGTQPRYLEWGRRPVSEPPGTSPTREGGSTPAIGTAGSTQGSETGPGIDSHLLGQLPAWSAPGSRSLSPNLQVSAEDELAIRNYLQNTCEGLLNDPMQQLIIAFIRTDEACTQLLLAYCYATSAGRTRQRAFAEQALQSAQRYFGRGTNLLWNRLRDPGHASSDANIQAVLLLVAYTSDFGQENEVEIHADALRTMVAQRHGLIAITNTVLRNQLASIADTRKYHLTMAAPHDCGAPVRFSDGFWPRS
jgi:hypothetical protein